MPVDPARGVAGVAGAGEEGAADVDEVEVAVVDTTGAYIGRRGSVSVPCPTIGTITITRSYMLRGSTRGCAIAALNEASRHTTGTTALRTFMSFSLSRKCKQR